CRVPGSRQVFDYRTGEAQPLAQANYLPYLGAGGWLLVVPRASAQADAALALLAELSGAKTSGEVVLEPAWGGGVFRREHFQALREGNAFDLGAARVDRLVDVLRQTLDPPAINPLLRLRTPDEREYRRALLDAVRAALERPETDPGQVLAAAARRW